MMDFYSDNDSHAAAWMRELIKDGHLPKGEVDETDIRELDAERLRDFRRVHLFAGIGGWAYAFELAGWPRERPVWSGSCPCQPFSAAGKRAGEKDARHLWPSMFRLIRECRPSVVFGEQVSGDDGYRWLAGVQHDLEAAGYAFGAADLPACGAGAPHRRYRLFWVGYTASERRRETRRHCRRRSERFAIAGAQTQALDDAEHGRSTIKKQRPQSRRASRNGIQVMGHAESEGQQEQWREYRPSGEGCSGLVGLAMQAGVPQWNGPTVAVKCSDGARRVSAESGAFPLATRLPGRVVRLRGYGNSIVPQVAAEFIKAYLEAELMPA